MAGKPTYEELEQRVKELEKEAVGRKRVYEALRDSEAQKKAILDASIDRIRLVDKDMKIIWANKTSTMEDNIAPEDLYGKICYEFFADRDNPCVGCPTKKSLGTGNIEHSVMHQTKAKGITVETYWDNYCVPIKNESDDIVHLIQIMRNITEQRRAEEKEKEHHRNIELLSKTAMKFVEFPADKNIYNFIGEQLREFIGKDSYIVINTIDEEKSILTTRAVLGIGKFTDKIVKLLGRHPVGMTLDANDENLSELSDGKLHLNKEGLYVIFLKTVPKAVCNSLEKLLNIKKIYGIGFTKDNELFGTIVIILKEGAGELKNKQIVEAFLKQASIAVQKRQAEEALQESEEKYRGLFDESIAAVYLFDEKKNFLDSNQAGLDLLGYSREELLSMSIPDVDADPIVVLPAHEQLLSGDRIINYEHKLKRKDGKVITVLNNSRPLTNDDEQVVGMQSTLIDITERKRAEETIKQANEELLRAHNQRKILSKRLIDLLEKDRRQIAMELHDHIGQILASLKIDLELIHGQLKRADPKLGDQIKGAQEKAVHAIKDVKSISQGLRPGMIDALGLASSLRELFNEVARNTDTKVNFFSRRVPKRFDPEKELAVFRIAQEALTNIIKHARAKNVFVNLVKKTRHFH